MPTRVVWDTTKSPGKRGHAPAAPPRLRHTPAFFPDALIDSRRAVESSFERATSEGTLSSRVFKTRRSIPVGFRSSLLREQLQIDKSSALDDEDLEDEQEETLRLSSDDIRASPRLLGYLFSVVVGAVQLVSVYL